MGLVLNEEQRLLRESARELLSVKSPVSALRALRDSKDESGFSRELWQELVELGWAGMTLPEDMGGLDFGFQGLAVTFEETGRTLAATPLLSTVVLGARLVEKLGTPAQQRARLPKVADGTWLLALALDALPRHQPTQISTTAVEDGDGFVLNGSKTFVLDGHIADELLVVARTAGQSEAVQVFAVPKATSGLEVTRTWMVDSRNAANVTMKNVRVGAEARLGQGEDASVVLDAALDCGRVALAAEMLGSATEAFERTLAYLKMREQFGVLIGTFQALKHRAAHMFNELELTRSAVYAAASAIEEDGDDAASLASLAKSQAGKTFELVAGEAVQMHGGIGMTDDEEIGFFLKRSRSAQHALGDAVFHRDRYARLNGF